MTSILIVVDSVPRINVRGGYKNVILECFFSAVYPPCGSFSGGTQCQTREPIIIRIHVSLDPRGKVRYRSRPRATDRGACSRVTRMAGKRHIKSARERYR